MMFGFQFIKEPIQLYFIKRLLILFINTMTATLTYGAGSTFYKQYVLRSTHGTIAVYKPALPDRSRSQPDEQ
jgi:hypothetical protein